MRKAKRLLALVLVLALILVAMPISVSAEDASVNGFVPGQEVADAETTGVYRDYYLQVLADYIDKYGYATDGGPMISKVYSGSNNWKNYYVLQHQADGVHMIFLDDNDYYTNYWVDMMDIRLIDGSTSMYISFDRILYRSGQVADYASISGTLEKTNYQTYDTFSFSASQIETAYGNCSAADFSSQFTWILSSLTEYWDEFFYNNLGFSLRNLGFTNFDGKPAACNHTWDNDCDTTCNKCGATRTTTHLYSNSCDPTCNVCGATRSVSCTYSGKCDAVCNVCKGVLAYERDPHTFSSSSDMTCNVCGFERESITMSNANYVSVAKRINNYGNNGPDGDLYPIVYIAENGTSDYWYMYTTSNVGNGLYFSVGMIPYDKEAKQEATVSFTLYENSDNVDVTFNMYDGKNDQSYEETVVIKKSTHTPTKQYTVNGKSPYFTKTNASSMFHTGLNLLLKYWDNYCFTKLGFGVQGLGFTAFGGHCTNHTYDNACDPDCNNCGATRTVSHSYGAYSKVDNTYHKRTCSICGTTETTTHRWDAGVVIQPPVGDTPGIRKHTCKDCGATKEVSQGTGDLNGDGSVDNKDVEYLLWHTLFPGSYPITGFVDFDNNGVVNNKDVEYLLWHTLFPDSYPL